MSGRIDKNVPSHNTFIYLNLLWLIITNTIVLFTDFAPIRIRLFRINPSKEAVFMDILDGPATEAGIIESARIFAIKADATYL